MSCTIVTRWTAGLGATNFTVRFHSTLCKHALQAVVQAYTHAQSSRELKPTVLARYAYWEPMVHELSLNAAHTLTFETAQLDMHLGVLQTVSCLRALASLTPLRPPYIGLVREKAFSPPAKARLATPVKQVRAGGLFHRSSLHVLVKWRMVSILSSHLSCTPSVDFCQPSLCNCCCSLSRAQHSTVAVVPLLCSSASEGPQVRAIDCLARHMPDMVMQAAYGSQHRPSTPQEKYLQQLQAKESKQVPPAKLSVLLLLFAGVPSTSSPHDII